MAQSAEKPVTSDWEILSYLSRTNALMALQRTINNAKDQQLHSHSQANTAPIRCAGLKRVVGFLRKEQWDSVDHALRSLEGSVEARRP